MPHSSSTSRIHRYLFLQNVSEDRSGKTKVAFKVNLTHLFYPHNHGRPDSCNWKIEQYRIVNATVWRGKINGFISPATLGLGDWRLFTKLQQNRKVSQLIVSLNILSYIGNDVLRCFSSGTQCLACGHPRIISQTITDPTKKVLYIKNGFCFTLYHFHCSNIYHFVINTHLVNWDITIYF